MSKNQSTSNNTPLYTIISVFFFWGFVAASNTILLGLFKKNFELTQFQSQLVDWAFYTAYFVGSLVYFLISYFKGDPLNKIGYKKGLVVGLVISALGALGFIPAAMTQSFSLMLTSLFIIAIGFALQQIVANPYVIALGAPATGSHRVNLAGGINSFGTLIGPPLLAYAVYGNISGPSTFIESDGIKKDFSISVERTSGKSETVKELIMPYDSSGLKNTGKNNFILITANNSDIYQKVYSDMVARHGNGVIFGFRNDSTANANLDLLKAQNPESRIPILKMEDAHAMELKALWNPKLINLCIWKPDIMGLIMLFTQV